MNQIVTGEAVTIDLRVARFGSRMIAAMIDLVLMLVGLYFAAIIAVVVVQPDNDSLASAVGILVFVGVFVGYPVLLETLTRGRTVGKFAMGLRVVRDDGGPIRFRHAFVRGLVGLVVERPGLLFLPGVVSMLVSNRSKRLGDLFAGTVVLQESVPRTMGAPPRMPPELASWAAMLDLTRLDDALVFSVRRLLARAPGMLPAARDGMASQLAAEIRNVVTPGPPPWADHWSYLSAVLAERTSRTYYRLVARSAASRETGTATAAPGPPPAYGAQPSWSPGPRSPYPPAPPYPPSSQYPPAPPYPPSSQYPPAPQYPPTGAYPTAHPPAASYPPVGARPPGR